MLKSPETIQEDVIVRTSDQLKRICSADMFLPITHTPNFCDQFQKLVKPLILAPSTSNWVPWFNNATKICHLYCFKESPGYATTEIQILSTGEWAFYSNKNERNKSNLELLKNIPLTLNRISDLATLIKQIDECKFCDGCGKSEDYKNLIKDKLGIYKRRDGTDGVLVEEDAVCSADCHILVPTNSTSPCQACQTSRHYLKTLESRRNTEEIQVKDKVEQAKARYDYKSRNELLEIVRESAKTIKTLKTQNRRLEEFREKMVNVGPNSNDDLKQMFMELENGLTENRVKLKKPICQWEGCHSTRFENVEELYRHCKSHIERLDTSVVPPIDRCYYCKWSGCKKHYAKLKLLENHLKEHSGNLNEEFLEILLSDQAKAIKTESRQMNFSAPQTGWKTENLRVMQESFDRMKPPNHARLGGLFYDEVKINAGLVFDHRSWELIGFTDLQDDDYTTATSDERSSTSVDNLASHVLQFFYRSTFFKFDFPCAYFMTKNTTALQLNRLFWLGVGMLHNYGFEVILSCCDGASSNRSFIVINTGDKYSCSCHNPYSGMPIFFFSDPPHLIKKLRNNLHSSGHKSQHSRFTRCLFLREKYILWDHVYAAYKRETRRHLYVTDLRKAHVTIDSVSKMRVKLAVQTLSLKVAKEMEECDAQATEETRKFILMCQTFWRIFNDPTPLGAIDDYRLSELDDVVQYFRDWESWLSKKYKTKAEQAQHYISWQTKFDLQGTVKALKELVKFLQTKEFAEKFGNGLYPNVKRISQDHVESYFSAQRQMCGGTQNMTGYTYGYNINTLNTIRSSRLLMKKQTNVYEVSEALPFLKNTEQLPKRKVNESIWDSVPWFINITNN